MHQNRMLQKLRCWVVVVLEVVVVVKVEVGHPEAQTAASRPDAASVEATLRGC